ncbi:hypothetical protein [Piscinibacter sakaiensis]|uniref:Uncharacterized protein n=1 Tax=Piscinibacter sakaiensis TaxID=1547922 RepID=A0A0K8NU21_PISS1|nr:hypothetical protein [Piscinibacter sakaiensis]GAP33863.1 hypothetical protein ISF6_1118 [Piscinibacter sakaiensis]
MAGLEPSDAAGAEPGRARLLALVGLAVALGCWMAIDGVRERVRELRQQDEARQQAVRPRQAVAAADIAADATAARRERERIEALLQQDEGAAQVQARVVHQLRQWCAAEGVQGCAVKYLEDPAANRATPAAASAPPSRAAGARNAAPATLADLGLARARAQVSGTFQDLEFRRFLQRLTDAPTAGAWKLNAVVVRNNAFELDLELIIRPAP